MRLESSKPCIFKISSSCLRKIPRMLTKKTSTTLLLQGFRWFFRRRSRLFCDDVEKSLRPHQLDRKKLAVDDLQGDKKILCVWNWEFFEKNVFCFFNPKNMFLVVSGKKKMASVGSILSDCEYLSWWQHIWKIGEVRYGSDKGHEVFYRLLLSVLLDLKLSFTNIINTKSTIKRKHPSHFNTHFEACLLWHVISLQLFPNVCWFLEIGNFSPCQSSHGLPLYKETFVF